MERTIDKQTKEKMKVEAEEYIENFRKEHGGRKSFIALRIRNGYIGKRLPYGFQDNRGKPKGTLVAFKDGNGGVKIGITYLHRDDWDVPIAGIAKALKNAVDGKNPMLRDKDKELYNFFEIRAKCFFYPEKYSYSRGTEKIEYPNYDRIHADMQYVKDCKRLRANLLEGQGGNA